MVQRAHYADAAAHLAIAREQIPESQARVLVALDGFIESHTRYWEAQQALHEASHRFVLASTDQEARFADLQEALAGARDLGSARRLEPPESRPAPMLESDQSEAHVADRVRDSDSGLPPLSIACFGRFEVRRRGEVLEPCRNRNGQAILRYLVAHPHHRETVDALVEALWPDDGLEVARHKLHVAASALRGALNHGLKLPKGAGYLLFKNSGYELEASACRVDADEFEGLFRAGQLAGGSGAVPSYRAACRLYSGAFLTEDLYADWSFMRREQLAQAHVMMCSALSSHELAAGHYSAAAQWATAMLEEDRCNESAYRQLMRAYAAQGRRGEALRQYHRCEQVLQAELGVAPMSETTAVFYAVLQGETPPTEPADMEEERSNRDNIEPAQ